MSRISTTFQKIFFALSLNLALNLLFFNLILASSPGDLDTSFGSTGIVTTSVSSGFDGGFGLIIQPDNKIIMAGKTADDFALARYNSDGSLDTNFKSTGVVTTSIGSRSWAYALALQQNGKIVAVGIASDNAFEQDIAVVRYNPDGTLDTDFKSTGVVTTHFKGDDFGRSVAIQDDGRIVVAGYTNGTDFLVLRYNTDGELDTNFNTTGIVSTSVGISDGGYAVLIQNDNKIIVAGETDNQFAALRYTTTGQLDAEFNSTGIVTTSIGSNSGGSAAALQTDGKIIVAGYAYTNGHVDRDFALVRYNVDGSLDTTFGSTGVITTQISSKNDDVTAITIQPNNKIVVAGNTNLGFTTGSFVIARYNPDGVLDTTFGKNGIVTTTLTSKIDHANGVKVQSDGKIVVGGYANEVRGSGNFAVVRYIGDFSTYLPIIMKQ